MRDAGKECAEAVRESVSAGPGAANTAASIIQCLVSALETQVPHAPPALPCLHLSWCSYQDTCACVEMETSKIRRGWIAKQSTPPHNAAAQFKQGH